MLAGITVCMVCCWFLFSLFFFFLVFYSKSFLKWVTNASNHQRECQVVLGPSLVLLYRVSLWACYSNCHSSLVICLMAFSHPLPCLIAMQKKKRDYIRGFFLNPAYRAYFLPLMYFVSIGLDVSIYVPLNSRISDSLFPCAGRVILPYLLPWKLIPRSRGTFSAELKYCLFKVFSTANFKAQLCLWNDDW